MKNIGRMILAMTPMLLLSAPPVAGSERERPASPALRIVEAGSAFPGFTVQGVSDRRGGPRHGGQHLGRHGGAGRHQLRRDHGPARPHVQGHHGVRPHHFRHAPRFERRHHGIHPGFRHHPGFERHHRHRPHTRFHFFLGAPLVRPWPPAVVAPPVVVQPAPPPVYVERPAQYWYYCQELQAYYPYVTECPGGWIPVVPHAR